MERTATAIAMALLTGLAAALSAAPVSAVDPDCTKDFDIADSELLASERDLDPNEEETGLEDVDANESDVEVTVDLETDDSELEFGIFEDTGSCDRSQNVSTDCASDVKLDTTGSQTSEDSETCMLHSPSSGVRDFYVVMENLQDSGDPLGYEIYVSS